MNTPGLISRRKPIVWTSCLVTAHRNVRRRSYGKPTNAVHSAPIARRMGTADEAAARWRLWATAMANTMAMNESI
jgi:hypothetical protein